MDALIIDACRTPRGIGKAGKGALSDLHPQHLAATVLKALAERNDLDTADVDDVIWGTSAQVGAQGGDLGRMAALDAGYDIRSSGVTLDRFCGSGITTVNLRRGADDVGHGGPGGRRRHRDDVAAAQPRRRRAADDGQRQPAPARPHPQSHQGVCADAIATLRGHHARATSTRWRSTASAARPRRSRAATSTRAWCRCTTRTARSRSTTRNSPARRPRPKAWPH